MTYKFNEMKNETILKELEEHLPFIYLSRLRMSSGAGAGEITICCTVADLIRDKAFNPPQEIEERISLLLAHFLKNHFKEPKK